jgi:glycosyltransferase involved in cell wall biosynthesis
VKVLHVSSDWKWTGSSEPMLRLLLAQRARGDEAALVCPEDPGGRTPSLAEQARAAGVEPVCTLAPLRGARWWRDAEDAGRLRALLAERRFDVIHSWHTRDHVLAWRAAGRRRGGPRIVRSHVDAQPIARRPWNRLLYGLGTDALLCASRADARSNQELCRDHPVRGALGAVDLERFRPGAPDAGVRAQLGLRPAQRVVGVVARVQRRRRFDLLLEAMRRLAAADPDARLLVIGRGTHLDAVARRPARRLGIGGRVVFAGYRRADYPDVLRAIDVLTYLVPGSDGGCRAVLEAAACGIPTVASRRGALPEIVAHGATGLLVDERPEALCAAWLDLLRDPARRAALGVAARRRAVERFHPDRLAAEVEALYRAAGASS